MSQFGELAVPTKIPDELWHDINRVRTAFITFAYNARMSVEAKELRTGEYDLEFDRWLEPLVDTAETSSDMRLRLQRSFRSRRKRAKPTEHLTPLSSAP